jgi:RNA polymerase sigma-70 factor (ECF subfamily)
MSEEHNFEAFMAAYQDMVFSTAMRLLGNSAEAEDISQEVFLKAYDRFAELSQSRTAGGWLKTVARNLCLNYLSRYRARWTFFSDLKREDDESDREFDIPAEDTQGEDAELADKRQLLELTLQKLPPAQRVPLVLYHFEELSYEEIAARLKLSLAARPCARN